jgi:hypothetical protein
MQRLATSTPNVLEYASRSPPRPRNRRLLVSSLLPCLYVATYLALHLCGYYHAYYDPGGSESGPRGWRVQDETGVRLLDAMFRPAIIGERLLRNRLGFQSSRAGSPFPYSGFSAPR